VIGYRDRLVDELDVRLVIASVQDAIDEGRAPDPGPTGSRNRLQTVALLDAITRHQFDAAFGGARRDEDKARAKERILSFRDAFGQWDPRNQRPELWRLYNPRVRTGEHLRAFPLSDWTEADIWRYVAVNGIELPTMYYSHRRRVVERDGMLLAVGDWTPPAIGEEPFEDTVRYRTVGDMTCTGAVRSEAANAWEVLMEIEQSRITERGATRADDRFSEAAMEDRKREGYF
jgi:sulfate adenylyltransferase subunit 2